MSIHPECDQDRGGTHPRSVLLRLSSYPKMDS